MQPFPTIEQAYAHVFRETTRQEVMVGDSNLNTLLGAVLASKSFKHGPPTSLSLGGLTRPILNHFKGPTRVVH